MRFSLSLSHPVLAFPLVCTGISARVCLNGIRRAERLEHARADEEDDNDAGRQAGMMMRQQHGDDGRLECIRRVSGGAHYRS